MRKSYLFILLIINALLLHAQNELLTKIYSKNSIQYEMPTSKIDSFTFIEQQGVIKNKAIVISHSNNMCAIFPVRNTDSICTFNNSHNIIQNTITDLNASSITISAKVNSINSKPILLQGFVWSKSPSPTYENYEGKVNAANLNADFSATINNLEQGTKYYIRAYLLTSETVYYANEIVFYPGTKPSILASSISVAYETTALGSATINNGGSPITASGFVWSKTNNPTISKNENLTINVSGSTSIVEYLSGLTPNSTYYVKSYASNIYGTVYGNEFTFNTNDKMDITNNVSTRLEMKTLYDEMYSLIKTEAIEYWSLDYLVFAETHADNAYRGTRDLELTQFEQQNQNRFNKNIARSWSGYYKLINAANKIICNIDLVPDATLTTVERKKWKSEALILRAMLYLDIPECGEMCLLSKLLFPILYLHNTIKPIGFIYPNELL